jgi:hypothetical protein
MARANCGHEHDGHCGRHERSMSLRIETSLGGTHRNAEALSCEP